MHCLDSDIDWNREYEVYDDYKLNAYDSTLRSVNIPSWAHCDQGYTPKNAMQIFINREITSILVSYRPNTTLGIGYSRIFIVDNASGKKFARMGEMWHELSMMEKSNNQSTQTFLSSLEWSTGTCKMDDDGRIRSAFGAPEVGELIGLATKLVEMYKVWRRFPNETDWNTVSKLRNAECDIYAMQMDARYLDQQIKDARSSIQAYQDRIAEWEKKMNDMYEKGADAMNLLEEHGVSIDLDKPERFDEQDELINGIGYALNPNLYTIKYSPGENYTIQMPIQESDSICSKASE